MALTLGRGTREPQTTTLWPFARLSGMLLFPFPFGSRLALVPRTSLKF
jgi:hypothetical protein